MSGARQAAVPRPPTGWWHFLLSVVLVVLSLPVFAMLVLALRLWVGPVDVTETARRLVQDRLIGLSFKRVRLTWNGWAEGATAPLGLIVDSARLDDPRIGQARAARAFVALDLPALLHGRVAVVVLRAADGFVDLSPELEPAGPGGHRLDLRALAELDLSHVVVGGRVQGVACRAGVSDMNLTPLHRPAAIGITGRMALSLSCGGPELALHGSAREGPGGEIVWHFATASFVPADLAGRPPVPLPLASLRLPMRLRLDAALSGGFGRLMLPRRLRLAAQLGAGTAAGVAVRQGLLRLSLDLPHTSDGTLRADLLPSSLSLEEGDGSSAPVLTLSGTLSRAGAAIRAHAEARVARFDFAGLDRIWPASLSRGARRWVTTNVTAGTGQNASVVADIASASGWPHLHLVGLSGGFDASGVTLFWLRPITPLRGMDARLTLEGPDAIRIESRTAVELLPGRNPISVGPTVMRITGLSGSDQVGRIDTGVRGSIADLLALLARPRLRLLSVHKLPFTEVSGAASVRLGLRIPLIDSVTADSIPMHADATLSQVHLGHAVGERALDAQTLSIEASNAGLALHGKCAIGGVPGQLTYAMGFRAGEPGQVTETAHLSARLDPPALERAGLGALDRAMLHFQGSALLDLGYASHRDGAARIDLAVDLTDAGLDTPIWRKRAGADARLTAVIGLRRDELAAIDQVRASGDGLALEGHGEVTQGKPSAVVIQHFTIGRSEGAGRIDLPAPGAQKPARVVLHGPTLDLAPVLDGIASIPGAGGAGGMAWSASLDFGRVLLGGDRSLDGVSLHAAATAGRISAARLVAGLPAPFRATLSPDAAGRRLRAQAPDTGALLAAFGLGTGIQGGALDLVADVRGEGAATRLSGVARIGRLTIRDAPLEARLARDLSVYGLVTGAERRRLVIARLEAPFTLRGATLRLSDAHASNPALGATMRGLIDLRRRSLDLRGTIVPSYLFNALPGKLPGVGRVFSPERGGGLLAATLRITGPIDRPVIRVNPFSLLAPGILRRLLFN